MIKVDLSKFGRTIDMAAYQKEVEEIHASIENKTGAGNDYLGWAHYPAEYDQEEFAKIKACGKEIREKYDCLVVCGIGGSYLGARAAIEGLNGLIADDGFEILFLGQTFASSYIAQALRHLEKKNFAINVISKSGTTTETALSFRLVKELLERKVGPEEAAKRIYATTDKEKGALLELSKKYGYTRFVLPSDIGGRYSVFTAVGLLPMAAAGIDIDAFMAGAKAGMNAYGKAEDNEAYKYAIARHELYKAGIAAEMFVTYEPRFVQLGEWWKQLFGESEGKDRTGLLPTSATFSTDLHSLGQFIQEGSPVLGETIMQITNPSEDVVIPHDEDNLDKLNYLEGKTLDYVNKKAHDGTIDAHAEVGNVPHILLEVEKMDPFALGQLLYFFMRACAMSCYLNHVNPFNQPGVEIYKKNMFHLLGKPGY